MPRRCVDVLPVTDVPKKRSKLIEDSSSLDVSFCDDEALPPGIIFTDVLQKQWRIGKPIGRGSFGRIYLASDDIQNEVTKQNARYVVKIEPHTNGPLFVEIHCLIRTAQAENVKEWLLRKKQKRLGMPVYIASGSFEDETSNIKYRFLVLPRYDIDLQKIISRGRTLDLKDVLILATQILDVLEYLHEQGYTHSDIKSSNLMLGFDGSKLSKPPIAKTSQSFQKDTKEVSILSGKQRRPKPGKSRYSNYYEDKDFVVNHKGTPFKSPNDFRKIFTDKEKRNLHRHHAFNLRQLSHSVNYEDINSVCSDQSYQKLLDDKKHFVHPSNDECFHSESDKLNKRNIKTAMLPPMSKEIVSDLFKEAILHQSNGQIYLLDYGLASKFLDSDGNHKDFGMDARKAHDGTLEYSSRDSHIGAHSRRSDLETLGYNLLDWLTGTLPWKTTEVLAEPDLVHALKKNFMSDVKTLLTACFKTESYPQFIEKYLQYVTNLDFTERPDYDYCRSIFRNEFVKNGFGTDKEMLLKFTELPIATMNRKKLCYTKKFSRKNGPSDFVVRNGVSKAFERENVCSLENNLKLELLKQTLNSSSDGARKPCTSRNFFISDADLVARLKKSLMPQETFGKKLSPKNLRSQKRTAKNKKCRGKRAHRSNSIGKFGNFMGSARQFTWAEILAGNPEDIIRKDRNTNEDEDTFKYRIRKLSDASDSSNDHLQSPLMQKDYLNGTNPTYAMKDVIANFRRKVTGKPNKDTDESEDNIEGYTPAMVKLLRIKERREAREAQELKAQLVATNKSEVTKRCTRSARNKSSSKPAVTRRAKTLTVTGSLSSPTEQCTTRSKSISEKCETKSKSASEKCETKSKSASEKCETKSKSACETKSKPSSNSVRTKKAKVNIKKNVKKVVVKEVVTKKIETENFGKKKTRGKTPAKKRVPELSSPALDACPVRITRSMNRKQN